MGATFSKEKIVKVNHELFKDLKAKAEEQELKRYRLCMHADHNSPVQEMIIAIKKGSYVQPHCHPDGRVESYSILEGELAVYIFDDNGDLEEKVLLSTEEGGDRLVRITSGMWHMPVAVTDWVVYHEVLQGPFDKDLVVRYADWAPSQESLEKVGKYMEQFNEL